MARHIFSLYEVGIQAILSISFVEGMKITPFNGSNFLNGSKPFLGGTMFMLVLVLVLVLSSVVQ
jgi:hypothetical protein